jgi:hypothetical protein
LRELNIFHQRRDDRSLEGRPRIIRYSI